MEGGGERKGMEGMVVGIVKVGIEGNEFIGGSGGRVLVRDGSVVGSEGKGGTVVWGSVGSEGKGGNAAGLGKEGIVGKFGAVFCKRWRAARLMLMLEKARARTKTVISDLLEAIAESMRTNDEEELQNIYETVMYLLFEIVWGWNMVLALIYRLREANRALPMVYVSSPSHIWII